ncbi:MAG: CAP domain-containing protein [Nannocystaceae bacterium]
MHRRARVTAPLLSAGLTLLLACDKSPEASAPPTAAAPRADAPPGPSADGPAQDARQDMTQEPDTDPSAEPAAVAGITAAHNRVRDAHKVAPLTWSPELAAFAQEWADGLAAGGCDLRHRDNPPYGENLFAITGAPASPDQVVGDWAAEEAGYDYKRGRCKGVCGHYTQVVWAKSQRLGCAMARCGDSEVWVCNYDPPGNYVGERPY